MSSPSTIPRSILLALVSISWVVGGPLLAGVAGAVAGFGHEGAVFVVIGLLVGLSGALAHSLLLLFSKRDFRLSPYALLAACLCATIGGLSLLAVWSRDLSVFSDRTLLSWAFGLSCVLSIATMYVLVRPLSRNQPRPLSDDAL
jgi:hypothetical protein